MTINKNICVYLLFLLGFLTSFLNPSDTLASDAPLIASEAFVFNIKIAPKTGVLTLNWQIAPQHYLYQDKIKVYILKPEKKAIPITLPEATILPDALFGDRRVYENHLTFTLPELPKTTTLSISYQGCSANQFCYPPQTVSYQLSQKNDTFTLSPLQEATDNQEKLSLHDSATQALKQANTPARLALFYLVGLLLAFTPCVLPMLPILASVIITEEKLSTLKGFFLSLSYVLSMATTYAIAGILAVKMGQSIQVLFQNIWVIGLFSLFFVYLGLVQLEKLPLKLPRKLMDAFHHLHHKQQGGHILGALILGLLGTLISSPCVTAPLVATLSYISQTGNTFLGGSSLFVMGLGMGTPMVILGTLGGRFIPKAGKWMQLVNELFALLLFSLAIWMVAKVLPPVVGMGLWGTLALLTSYFMGFFNKRKYRYLPKFGAIIGIYGLILITGACLGYTNPLKPFDFLHSIQIKDPQTNKPSSNLDFKTVTNLKDLNDLITQHQNKIILIDFYAEWCISCKHIEAHLFQDPDVITQLKNVILIKADITANGQAQHELMQAYQVFAPPSIYLFKTNKPNDFLQFHGEIDKQDFLIKLTGFSYDSHPNKQ